MSAYLRLRQICLVAEDLELQAGLIEAIFGLAVCHRDPNVAAYGLHNVLFPVGSDFLEIVSPQRPGTAAGRFLQRHGGRYGYMIIMDCDDPEARQRHCNAHGVRTAHLIRHPGYLGVQLHPKDTGGAMLEFNHTEGGDDPMGAYGPAGPGWQKFVRNQATRRMTAAEIDCADPAGFGARWAGVLQRPLTPMPGAGGYRILLDSGEIRFLRAEVAEPVLAGIELQVADSARVLAAAGERGSAVAGGTLDLCGMRFRLTEKD